MIFFTAISIFLPFMVYGISGVWYMKLGTCLGEQLFLISDLAKVITGANLDVNGGEFMT